MIPACKTDVVSDTVLDLFINEAVKDISANAKCLTTTKKFNAVADQGSASNPYVISTVIADYLVADKGGLWWNEGTVAVPDYTQLNARTVAWLNENRPDWQDLSSGYPEDYAIEGNNLYIVPAPVASLTDGFKLFYIKIPSTMINAGSYPFSGSTVEFTHLSMFDFAIIYYCRWKISPAFNKDGTENLSLQEYMKERQEKIYLMNRRPDISNSSDSAFKGKIC
jgi:hypothetical protein